MNKRQARLVEEVRRAQHNCRFEALARMLEAFGYLARESGSSHVVFRRAGSPPLTVPRSVPVKLIYVRKALDALLAIEEA